MKNSVLLLASLLLGSLCFAQQQYRKPVKPVKNIIVMIPDGTSMSVVTAARWYNINKNAANKSLALDPYLCGVVSTFCSNAPIGDSAPTTSCYMTGIPQRVGNVSIYPVADPGNDLINIDPTRAYQPLATIFEAARITQNKSIGLVVTCEFPHATPADCSSHYYDRSVYKYIAPQMAYNNLTVMFGGGNANVSDDMKAHFRANETTFVSDDLKAFRALDKKKKAWALFGQKELPYDIDRDTLKTPSLAEMTGKALSILSQDKDGFVLMVEGSLVDWAAHSNDAVGMITEYLAFDKAVAEAMEFARKDGNTVVLVLPDHSNSGFSIGNERSTKGYATKTLKELFGEVTKYNRTEIELGRILLKTTPENLREVFQKYAGSELTDYEYDLLYMSSDYTLAEGREGSTGKSMFENIKAIVSARNYFGFTTGGHTGEDVFLAAYHPQGDIPTGMNLNTEINQYLHDVAGLNTSLEKLTDEIFAKHNDVFQGMEFSIDTSGAFPVLTVKSGRNTLVVPAFKSVATFNGKQFDLGSVTVYIDKNSTFYLPRNLRDKIRQ